MFTLTAATAALILGPSLALAAQAPSFVAPAPAPTAPSTTNYVGASNGSLPAAPIVPGKVFDRFIQIWLENTDFNDAATSSAFQALSKQGILLNNFYALTHPSEPNYAAVAGGDFFGMGDDNWYRIPANISTIVDLLEAKNISWAEYQENMPSDGFEGFNFTSANYLNTSAPPYTFYVRKHNPLILYDSVTSSPSRLARIRNFNDLASDLSPSPSPSANSSSSSFPQWSFITPNMVNDGHDTSIDFASQWLNFFLPPLLSDPSFNDNRTLILLTFDENENYAINNQIYTLLLGGAVPESMWGSNDTTYYTHYSALSTVQANWGLGSLGRQDTNATVSNVFKLVADKIGWTNVNVSDSARPLTNITGVIPGALNAQYYTPYTAPLSSATGAGGGPVFVSPLLNISVTPQSVGSPVNLTALNMTVPSLVKPNVSGSAPAPGNGTSGQGSGNAGVAMRGNVGGAMLAGLVVAVVAMVL